MGGRGTVRHPPDVKDAAMKLWVQGNRPSWRELSRRVEEATGVKVYPATLRSWYENEIPMSWDVFEQRYKSIVYMNEAERLAREAAEVREHTWTAIRALFSKMIDDLSRWRSGEIDLQYRSADHFIAAFIKLLQTYNGMFGNPDSAIAALLEKIPKEDVEALLDDPSLVPIITPEA